MATWCGTCISETDDFREALNAYPELFIISVDVDPTETDRELDRFRRAYSRPDFDNRWFFARDTDQVSAKYGAPFTGTTILIDKQGNIAYRDSWSTDFEEIQKAMIKLGYGAGEGVLPLSEQSVEEKLAAYNLNLEQEIDALKELYKNQGYHAALIEIDNMFCPACPRTIKAVIYRTVPGIKEIIISFYEGKGLVVYDPKQTSADDIVNSPIFDETKYPDAPTIYDASLIEDITLCYH
jgi:copper chaperone CopZ